MKTKTIFLMLKRNTNYKDIEIVYKQEVEEEEAKIRCQRSTN